MFTLGFQKIADNAATGGGNNQGLGFNSSDTNNTTADVGPGGMTPQGIESFNPIPKQPAGKPKNKPKGEDEKKEKFNVALFLMQKGASVRGVSGASAQKDVPGFTDNTTVALKYDSSSVDPTQSDVSASSKEEKSRIKKYKRAERK